MYDVDIEGTDSSRESDLTRDSLLVGISFISIFATALGLSLLNQENILKIPDYPSLILIALGGPFSTSVVNGYLKGRATVVLAIGATPLLAAVLGLIWLALRPEGIVGDGFGGGGLVFVFVLGELSVIVGTLVGRLGRWLFGE